MEGSLLDLGFATPPPAASNQQQVDFDPFGVPQNQTQPQPNPQADGFDAAFGASQANVQQNPNLSAPQQSQDLNFGMFDEPKASTQQTSDTSAAANPSSEQNTPAPIPADNSSPSLTGSDTPNEVTQQTSEEAVSADGGAQEVVTPSTPLDNKAKLKQIQQLFSGKWKLVRSEPFGEYLKAAGVGLVTRNRASNGSTELTIGVKDESIYFNSSTLLHSQITRYQLDETLETTWMKTEQSVFCSYQDQKLELQMTPAGPAWSKTQGVQYALNERNELMVTYTVGSNVCRRVFGKVMMVVA